MTNQGRSWRSIGELALVGVCTLALGWVVLAMALLLFTGNHAERRDVVSYWAAARQVEAHRNPYSSEEIDDIERAAGFPEGERAILMRNPPTAFPLILPLGFLSLRAASLLWSLLLLGCLAVSVRVLWSLYGRSGSRRALLGYTFAPALACVLTGQTALFLLLGMALFLRFYRTRPLLAGASLWLCALKPHLFLPLGVVLAVWVVRTKSYRIAWGAAAAMAVSAAVAYGLDPHAWSEYSQMMRTWGLGGEYHPCLSVALRLALRPGAMWLQDVPTVAGCVWALAWFWKRRARWDWARQGSLLLLISVFTAPYAWFTDQAVLLPAILCSAWLTQSRRAIGLLMLLSAAIEVEMLLRVPVNSPLYLWTAPVWLLWYWLATRRQNQAGSEFDERSLPSEFGLGGGRSGLLE